MDKKRKLTASEKFGKLKLKDIDKPLSAAEQKAVFKEWNKDYQLAKDRDQCKRR